MLIEGELQSESIISVHWDMSVTCHKPDTLESHFESCLGSWIFSELLRKLSPTLSPALSHG